MNPEINQELNTSLKILMRSFAPIYIQNFPSLIFRKRESGKSVPSKRESCLCMARPSSFSLES